MATKNCELCGRDLVIKDDLIDGGVFVCSECDEVWRARVAEQQTDGALKANEKIKNRTPVQSEGQRPERKHRNQLQDFGLADRDLPASLKGPNIPNNIAERAGRDK